MYIKLCVSFESSVVPSCGGDLCAALMLNPIISQELVGAQVKSLSPLFQNNFKRDNKGNAAIFLDCGNLTKEQVDKAIALYTKHCPLKSSVFLKGLALSDNPLVVNMERALEQISNPKSSIEFFPVMTIEELNRQVSMSLV